MLILAIDTTGPLCSCALYDDCKDEIRLRINETDYSHLEEIAPMIMELMKSEGTAPEDIDAVAVSRGPGSFTGVRIGMATAKALTQIWKKPVICVPTLDAFAYGEDAQDGEIICPLFDARRDQVYAAAFIRQGCGVTELISETAISLDGFIERLCAELSARKPDVSSIVFRGDGAEKYEDKLLEAFEGASLAEKSVRYQTAEQTARLGSVLFAQGKYTDCYGAEPEYLREAEAEKKLREKKPHAV